MTLYRIGDEIREIKCAPTGGFGRVTSRTALHPRTKQFCSDESDERLRRIIRALDERERQIVIEELRKEGR